MVEILPGTPPECIVADILIAAERHGSVGEVARRLVEATLAIRFPDIPIVRHSWASLEEAHWQTGEFLVGDTVFHVSVSPMLPLLERAAATLQAGRRATLLVAEATLGATRLMAKTVSLDHQIGIFAIESFVGQTIEFMGGFDRQRVSAGFRALLLAYNRLVAEVEREPSLLIPIPDGLVL